MKKKKVKVTEFSKLENKVAALWTRVSTEKQERNNCSLENQQRICREYAERHGITIKKEFGGTHESAKTEGKMYREMIAEVARDKEINIILVYSFDRFSRAGSEAIMTKAYLKQPKPLTQIVQLVHLWKTFYSCSISLRMICVGISVLQV